MLRSRDMSRSDQRMLCLLVLLAACLRVVPLLIEPSMNWADEIFQATEQAHRLVYGTGLIPWEFQLGIRSWLLPGTIAGLMELARLFGEGRDFYLPVIAGAFALLATVPVICCALWCRRMFTLPAAIAGGVVAATMPDLVYFGARTLSEVVAGNLLVAAIYALDPDSRDASPARLVSGGAILGLVFALRIQLAPALLVVGIWSAVQAPRRRLLPIAGAAVAMVMCAGMLDAATLGAPFASIWRYVLYNLYYDVSATFGVQPWTFYGVMELGFWGFAFVPVMLLALLGARRKPFLVAPIVAIVAVHSAVAHKEFRFIYPAFALIGVLAGIGLAQLVAWCGGWLRPRGGQVIASIGSAAWCAVALLVWNGPSMAALLSLDHDNLRAASFVAHGPAPCGIGFYGHDGMDWGIDGGYTYIDRPVPMYWPKDEGELRKTAAGFDTLIFTQQPAQMQGFATSDCFGDVCVARRLGGCTAMPEMPMPFPDPVAGLRPKP